MWSQRAGDIPLPAHQMSHITKSVPEDDLPSASDSVPHLCGREDAQMAKANSYRESAAAHKAVALPTVRTWAPRNTGAPLERGQPSRWSSFASERQLQESFNTDFSTE